MAAIVWFTMGIAIWHFLVFVPDRFWQGIIGALIGSTIGAVVSGAAIQAALGRSLGETDLVTALMPLPGVAAGLAVVWAIGVRQERRQALEAAQSA